MQELRSTDILDKEIEADAKRKAEAILKRADKECEEIIASVQNRINVARQEKEEFYSKKLDAFEKDLKASGPLEKQRFQVSFIQEQVIAAINKYLCELKEEERLALVTQHFDFSVCKDRKINAYVYGFDFAAAEKLLKEKLGNALVSCKKTEFGKIMIEEDLGLENNQGIILEAEDKSMRARLTLVQVLGGILDNYRQELSEALFGGSL
jgi:V/A-type H+-transporting ATPase subunit E